MESVRKAERLLLGAEKGLLVVLLSVMVALSFLQVVLRQAFGLGILWADTFLRHLVLWVGFLGAGLAAADNKHFAWEPAAQKAGRMGAAMRAAASAAAVAITCALVRASWSFLCDERAAGDVLFQIGSRQIPAWWFSTIIPAGFALIAIHLAVRGLEALGSLRDAR